MNSPKTTVKRLPERARYERDDVYAILDEAPYCTVAFVDDGVPFAIPTIHARVGDVIYLHGSTASRMLGVLGSGAPVCITATLLDGLVFARSAFHHSMNYRSAVVLGHGRLVEDERERLAAMRAVVEHVAPGRWDEARSPSAKESAATRMIAIEIEEASAKIRTGPPKDDAEDLHFEIWAGVLPLHSTPGDPISDSEGVPVPASVRALLDR